MEILIQQIEPLNLKRKKNLKIRIMKNIILFCFFFLIGDFVKSNNNFLQNNLKVRNRVLIDSSKCPELKQYFKLDSCSKFKFIHAYLKTEYSYSCYYLIVVDLAKATRLPPKRIQYGFAGPEYLDPAKRDSDLSMWESHYLCNCKQK